MSKKQKYVALAFNLAGFLIVGWACGDHFWQAMFGVAFIDWSARALGKTTIYDK